MPDFVNPPPMHDVITGYDIIKNPDWHSSDECWCIDKRNTPTYGILSWSRDPADLTQTNEDDDQNRPIYFIPYDVETQILNFSDMWPLKNELYSKTLSIVTPMLANNAKHPNPDAGKAPASNPNSELMDTVRTFLTQTDEGRQLVLSAVQNAIQGNLRPVTPTRAVYINDRAIENILEEYLLAKLNMPENKVVMPANALHIYVRHISPTEWYAEVECDKWSQQNALTILSLIHELHGLPFNSIKPVITQQLGEKLVQQALKLAREAIMDTGER